MSFASHYTMMPARLPAAHRPKVWTVPRTGYRYLVRSYSVLTDSSLLFLCAPWLLNQCHNRDSHRPCGNAQPQVSAAGHVKRSRD